MGSTGDTCHPASADAMSDLDEVVDFGAGLILVSPTEGDPRVLPPISTRPRAPLAVWGIFLQPFWVGTKPNPSDPITAFEFTTQWLPSLLPG